MACFLSYIHPHDLNLQVLTSRIIEYTPFTVKQHFKSRIHINPCFCLQTVMRRLVRRYIHQSKKTMRQDGVNEDDLLEIKQDISSLR